MARDFEGLNSLVAVRLTDDQVEMLGIIHEANTGEVGSFNAAPLIRAAIDGYTAERLADPTIPDQLAARREAAGPFVGEYGY